MKDISTQKKRMIMHSRKASRSGSVDNRIEEFKMGNAGVKRYVNSVM